MSHHEANKIQTKLIPFMSLLLAVACMGLLASCGGGSTLISGVNNRYAETEFDKNQIVLDDKSKDLNTGVGYIANQKWIIGANITESQIRSKIEKYPQLKIIRYSDLMGGLLVEFNINDESTQLALKQLETDIQIDSIYYRSYTGPKAKITFFAPNDGSLFSDRGDNWGQEFINLPAAWDYTNGSPEVSIAVFDAGFELSHNDIFGRAYILRETPISAHGNAVIGIIGAKYDNGFGVSGINQKSPIYVGNVECLSDGFPEYYFDTITAYERNSGLKIVSNSWGCMGYGSNSENGFLQTRAYRSAAIKTPNVLHVWAAGNDGSGASAQNGSLHLDNNRQTSKLGNVLIVGAFVSDGTLAQYSNFGALVDIAAPTDVKSTALGNDYYSGNSGYTYGNNVSLDDTKGFGGTSAAAPFVAGVASLVFSINPKLSPIDVKNILIDSAVESIEYRYLPNGGKEKLPKPIPILNAEKAVQAALATLPKPTATIDIITPTPTAGLSATFKPVVTTFPNGAVTEFEWDFGDGTVQMQTGSEMFHTYTSGGIYTVKLKTKDVRGVTNTTTKEITVAGVAIVPTITDLTFTSATANTAAKLTAVFSTDMQSGYSTTGAYVPKVGKEGYWLDPRTFVIEFNSFTSGGQINLVASGFKSAAGTPLASDRSYTFPEDDSSSVLLSATVTDSCGLSCPYSIYGNPQFLLDGSLTGGRNLGTFSGYFDFLLPQSVTIGSVVIVPSMNPNGNVDLEILTSSVGVNGPWVSQGRQIISLMDSERKSITLTTAVQNVKALRIQVHSSPSWVALLETEAYSGTPPPAPVPSNALTFLASTFDTSSSINIATETRSNCQNGLVYNAPPYTIRSNTGVWVLPTVPSGRYSLEIEYAALESRPVDILLNGTSILTGALADTTGSWCSSNTIWKKIGEITLGIGTNQLQIYRASVFPHLKTFRLTPVYSSSVSGSIIVAANTLAGTPFVVPSNMTSCQFNASGTWRSNTTTIDANGIAGATNPNFTWALPLANSFSLIAKFPLTGYTFIGTSASRSVTSGDTIYFLMNDSLSNYGDNSGSLQLDYSCTR